MSNFDLLISTNLFILVSNIQSSMGSSLNDGPRNVAVNLFESQVEMNCTTNSPNKLWWTIRSKDTSMSDNVISRFDSLDNSSLAKYMSIRSSGNEQHGLPYHTDLLISNASLELGQTYFCVDTDAVYTSSAELIVLEQPQCFNNTSRVNASFHLINLQCNLTFRGNWAPVMEWRMGNTTITDGITNVTTFNDSISYSLILHLDSSFSGSAVSCTVKFIASMRPTSTNATNVPEYQRTIHFNIGIEEYQRTIYCNLDFNGTCATTNGSTTPPPNTSGIVAILCGLLVVALLCLAIIIAIGIKKKNGDLGRCGKREQPGEPDVVNSASDRTSSSNSNNPSNNLSDSSSRNVNVSTNETTFVEQSLYEIERPESTVMNVGQDGTVYQTMGSGKRGRPRKPKKIEATYAVIDHTVEFL